MCLNSTFCVQFLPGGAAALLEFINQSIESGQSMGKAFRAAGIEFRRETEFACHRAVPAAMQTRFDDEGIATVVGVRILAGPDTIPYAVITETYAPVVTWPRLFGAITRTAEVDLDLLAAVLAGHQE